MHEDSLLDRARQAHRAGAMAAAEACYREYLAHHPDDGGALLDFAGVLHAMDRQREAERVLDGVVQAWPEVPAGWFNRSLVRRAAGHLQGALEDLDRLLAIAPGHLPARLNRGALLSQLGRPEAAFEDFDWLCTRAPAQVEGHYNAGLTLLQLNRPDAAADRLRRADDLAPGTPGVLRALGNALQACGRSGQALEQLRKAVDLDPGDALSHGDLGMCLLASGRPGPALAAFERALELDPGDQTALAGLYLAHNEAGHTEAVAEILDFSLWGCDRLGPIDVGALRAAVLSHPALSWEPAGKTTRHGEQTAFLDLAPGSAFHDFGIRVAEAVRERIAVLSADPVRRTHPWMRARPRRWRLRMWATVLHRQGHQAPHIHPAGWMSGVYYLDAGATDAREGGTIVFGTGPAELALRAAPRTASHQPASGDLLTFPSFFHHHTLPFSGQGLRISLAFDVVPG